jgi:hypothetical protein
MTLMRNGRDRRLVKPGMGHATLERVFLFGTRSADHIRASGHGGRVVMGTSSPFENRPDTWLHPNASRKRQILLAPRAPSIHGPSVWTGRALQAESDDLEKLVLRICIRPIHGAFELLAIMDIRACSISFASRPRRPYGPPDHERAGETFLHLLISTRRPRWES